MLSGASGATLVGAVGAVLLGGGNAAAVVTHTNGNIKYFENLNQVLSHGGVNTFTLNVDGGGNDLKFGTISMMPLGTVTGLGNGSLVRYTANWNAVNFAKDAQIKTTAANQWTQPSCWLRAKFDPGGGYLGIKLGDSGTNYGWVYLDSWTNTSFRIASYAYNTAGGSINAGETGAVPEPSTIALALLASGAAGVMASRRKKLLKGRRDA